MHTRLRKTGSNALKAFDPVFVSSVNQGKRSFSGRKQPPAPSSSLPDGSPAVSSSSPAAVFTPENSKGLSGQQELGKEWGMEPSGCGAPFKPRNKKNALPKQAPRLPLPSREQKAQKVGGDPASRFAAGSSKKRQKLSRLTGRGGRIGPPLPVRRY